MAITSSAASAQPSVNITFEGLLIFAFEKEPNGKCFVGVVPCPNHSLRLTINDQKSIELTSRKISFISNGKQGVTKYTKGSVAHKSRLGDENDLGWLMAIEGSQFHNSKLQKDVNVIQQRFELNTGLFYTAARTSDAIIRGPQGIVVDPATIAATIGCNITLEDGEVLSLLLDGILVNEFKSEAEINKIKIEYVCDTPALPNTGDFDFFYQVYNGVPTQDRFDVISTSKQSKARGLTLQARNPDLCPPIEGEPPIG